MASTGTTLPFLRFISTLVQNCDLEFAMKKVRDYHSWEEIRHTTRTQNPRHATHTHTRYDNRYIQRRRKHVWLTSFSLSHPRHFLTPSSSDNTGVPKRCYFNGQTEKAECFGCCWSRPNSFHCFKFPIILTNAVLLAIPANNAFLEPVAEQAACVGNISDLRSGGARFEPRHGQRLYNFFFTFLS
jgi:hypothetical protein